MACRWLMLPLPVRRFSPVEVNMPSRCLAQSSIVIGISRSLPVSLQNQDIRKCKLAHSPKLFFIQIVLCNLRFLGVGWSPEKVIKPIKSFSASARSVDDLVRCFTGNSVMNFILYSLEKLDKNGCGRSVIDAGRINFQDLTIEYFFRGPDITDSFQ